MVLRQHGTGRDMLVLTTVLCCSWATIQAAAAAAALQQQPDHSSNRRVLAQASAGPIQESPKFESAVAALFGLPEGRRTRDLYMYTYGKSDPSVRYKFQGITALVANPRALITIFHAEDVAWQLASRQLCMSFEQAQDTVTSKPDMWIVKVSILNGTTLLSSDFKDGAVLQTMEPGFTLTLRKRTVNGTTQWYFPGADFAGDDVIITNKDIMAGSAVVHLVDKYILSPALRKSWGQQARLHCRQGEVKQEQRQQSLSAGATAGIAIACAVAAAAVIAFNVLLVRKRLRCQRSRGGVRVGSPDQQQELLHMPPHQRPDSGSDAGWRTAVPDDAVATTTPDRTQEQMPPASKDPLRCPGSAVGGIASAPLSTLPARATPQRGSVLARGDSAACSERLAASAAASQLGAIQSENHLRSDDLAMTPLFELDPMVPESKLAAWLRLSRDGKAPAAAAAAVAAAAGGSAANVGAGNDTNSSGSSGSREAAFAEQLRQELHPQLGNPNIIGNYTAFTREVEHSNTAVYFCEGMHNNKQFALKFYASQADFTAEMMAYKELGGPSSKFVPVLEMSYPGNASYPTSVLVFERGQCTLETFARQRPSYFQQIDIFHQLVSAVQHLHEHGLVHRDLKPSNVVHFPEKFAWKLIDLATIARIGEETKVVYTRKYVSPEVAQAVVGGAVSIVAQPSWDLWGIGIIMWEMVTGQRYFPPEWSMDGGRRRMWSALCCFEPLPHEIINASAIKGADRGIMKLVRRLLQRDPALRPTPQQLLSEMLFQAHGVTTTQVSSGRTCCM